MWTSAACVEIERPDFAAMAGTALRDQPDLDFAESKGGGFMRTGHYVSAAGTAGRLPLAPSTVTIGADGFNEWRAVEAGGVLNLNYPLAAESSSSPRALRSTTALSTAARFKRQRAAMYFLQVLQATFFVIVR